MTYIELLRKYIAEGLKYQGQDLDVYFSDLCYENDLDIDSYEYQEALHKGQEIFAKLEEKVRSWEI